MIDRNASTTARRWTLGLAAAALLAIPSMAGAQVRADEPYSFDFAFNAPQRVEVMLPGQSTPTTYWYVLFTATNNTGRDRRFRPQFEMVADDLTVLPAMIQPPEKVFDAIKARHDKDYPFLVPLVRAQGTLRQGVTERVDSVAIFPDLPTETNNFSLFVRGLAGPVKTIDNPLFKPGMDPEGDIDPTITLHKTLHVKYRLPGDEESRKEAEPQQIGGLRMIWR